MRKSRKFSKGYSNGFIPEYRHAVETMAESEGLGTSGQVDTGITLSEDSCTPKKCISLSRGCYDQFGIPLQVLSPSRMSKSERRDTELKLKRELEQVRILQKKVASLNADVVDLSPSSVCSVGRKRPPNQSIFQNQPAPGKKHALKGRNGSFQKRVPLGHVDSMKKTVSAGPSIASLMKLCSNLLTQMMSHKFGWAFNTPVDPVELNIPDYYTIIKHPMDFSTIKNKIATGEYSNPLGFSADVRLTFLNAITYNPMGNDFHVMAKTLSKYFETKWKTIEKKIPLDVQLQPLERDNHMNNSLVEKPPSLKRKKLSPGANQMRPEPVEKLMTIEDKHKLSIELESLLSELPDNIIDFLKENSPSAGQDDEDEIEIDIDALNNDTLTKLRKLLDDFVLERKKRKTTPGPSIMEVHDKMGFSNLLIQPCKGDDADEDIDIGGNDSPILSFSPVRIENKGSLENSKSSNSSNSSSESGSSSSDSDSGSSSDSESEGKAATCVAHSKEFRDDENFADKKNANTQDSGASRNECSNGQVEQNPDAKPPSVDEDGHSEGENAPSEKQVSPDKVYRAALLKSRFADTILKAQQKALEKEVTRNPEKLRLDREELEKRQRQEKARLQAEVKAAEEARKKAEAQAAAEVKRKRELEREAARLALQKMEKTVDINVGCQIMEDLEMFRSSTPGADNLSGGLVEDASSNHSENVLGWFKLQGSSNPLEQLGLYMKADGEEEEELEDAPQCTLDHVNDDF